MTETKPESVDIESYEYRAKKAMEEIEATLKYYDVGMLPTIRFMDVRQPIPEQTLEQKKEDSIIIIQ